MDLFDVIDTIFKYKPKFLKLSKGDKSRHYFMINRFMAITNPSIAMQLSFYGINSTEVINYWFQTVGQQYTTTPRWMYIKVKKEREKKKLKLPEGRLVAAYCEINEIEEKTFWELYKLYPEDLLKELDEYVDYAKSRE